MGHLERKIRERENLRKAMLEAALEIAENDGWQALTIRKIAEAIEYTAPIVYEHFTNKEELICEIIEQGFHTMFDSYKVTFELGLSPKDILLEISMRHWDFAYENKMLYQLMFSMERRKPGEEFIKIMTTIQDTFAQITHKDGKELGSIIFNWLCLMNGTISATMTMENKKTHHAKELDINPKEMYKSFIERFLNSIS